MATTRSYRAEQYTPIVELPRKFGYPGHAKGAWLFSERHRVLRPFYERVKALWEATEGDPDARRQVKRLYTVTFGIWPMMSWAARLDVFTGGGSEGTHVLPDTQGA